MYYYEDEDRKWYTRAQWVRRWVWWPVRCYITGAVLWMEWAYRGTMMYTGPGDPVYEHRWHESDTHLIWLLKS